MSCRCRRPILRTLFILLSVSVCLVISHPAWVAARQDVFIVLDPGHGGDDAGVIGAGGATEKDLCLDLAERVKKKIDQLLGYPTFLTRSRDETLSLQERAAQANNHLGTVYISIHLAGFPDQSVHGFGIYYLRQVHGGPLPSEKGSDGLSLWNTQQAAYLDQSSLLAEALHQEFIKDFPSDTDLGVHALPVYPFGALSMPAVLIEPAVLTNPVQEGLLRKEAFREEIADAIFQGIRVFVKADHGGGDHE